MNSLIQLRKVIPVFFVALVCFALSPVARAQCTTWCDGSPDFNTAFGNMALPTDNGNANTAFGYSTLANITTGGINNTAIGYIALYHNTTGTDNTAIGVNALARNLTGTQNTATGEGALFNNTTVNGVSGNYNTATGFDALLNNETGINNTAVGVNALLGNNANDNTAIGANALYNNKSGTQNTATGEGALGNNTTINGVSGNYNTADGFDALLNNTTGSNNMALGFSAGSALTTGSNNIDIGNAGVAAESGTIRIGTQGTQTKAFIAGIHGVPVTGVAVKVTATGQLGTQPSSKRFKDEIKPMDKASEAILALKPVTFRYKKEIDAERTPQFGLVAEDVEKVSPDLVVKDLAGEVYTVRYDAVNAMLLNEFLKEHRKVETLEATAARQQQQIAALTATVQKVSAQLEVSKPAPQTVLNSE